MLNETIIEFIAQTVKNQLQAHDEDLKDEMDGSEDGRTSITFTVSLYKITPEKLGGKIRSRIPRAATVVESLLPDFKQEPLPGMK
jgi:hypothetical protein